MSDSRTGFGRGILVLIVAVIAVVVIGVSIAANFVETPSGQVSGCTVTDKDRTRDNEGGSDMRIYTENCGTLRVGDNIARGTFDSSDLYAQIEKGHTYDFKATGWRIPIISHFPKIYEVKEA